MAKLNIAEIQKEVTKEYFYQVKRYARMADFYGRPSVKLDMRFSKNKEIARRLNKMFNSTQFLSDVAYAKARLKMRKDFRKYTFSNILNNHLVIDWIANKRNIRNIIPQKCMQFISGRNHYIRDAHDIKILRILENYIR